MNLYDWKIVKNGANWTYNFN